MPWVAHIGTRGEADLAAKGIGGIEKPEDDDEGDTAAVAILCAKMDDDDDDDAVLKSAWTQTKS